MPGGQFQAAQLKAAKALTSAGFPFEIHRALLTDLDPITLAAELNALPALREARASITPEMIETYIRSFKPGETVLVTAPIVVIIAMALATSTLEKRNLIEQPDNTL